MALSHSKVVERFADYSKLSTRGSNVYSEDNILYSHGPHFPMVIRAEKGSDFGRGIKFIINGDKYSSSTSSHQNMAIHTCIPNVQIPFSALFAARISNSYRTRYIDFKIVDFVLDAWEKRCRVCKRNVEPNYDDCYWYIPSGEPYDRKQFPRYMVHMGTSEPLCEYKNSNNEIVPVEFRSPITHHTLGGVVLCYKSKYYLSSMDFEEKIPNYFLSKLPHKVKTVSEAFDSLKPQIILDIEAEFNGESNVERQGDIFVYKTELSLKEIKELTGYRKDVLKYQRLYNTNHVATYSIPFMKGLVFVNGCLYHRPERRSPDHRRVAVNDGWYIAVKNRAVESWSAEGMVD